MGWMRRRARHMPGWAAATAPPATPPAEGVGRSDRGARLWLGRHIVSCIRRWAPSLVRPGAVRERLRELRHGPDRMLHPFRRERALRRVRRAGDAGPILVVCHGNICRSPFAAALVEALLGERAGARLDTESAGFLGQGRGCPPDALAAAAAFGVDLAAHRSSVLTPARVGRAGLVVVMEPAQARAIRRRFRCRRSRLLVLGDLDPGPIETRTIVDPVERGPAAFRTCYARIERCVRILIGASAPGPASVAAAS